MNKNKEFDDSLKRERLRGKEMALTRSVSLTESDLEIARVLGRGNASHGIKMALRLMTKLDQATYELL